MDDDEGMRADVIRDGMRLRLCAPVSADSDPTSPTTNFWERHIESVEPVDREMGRGGVDRVGDETLKKAGKSRGVVSDSCFVAVFFFLLKLR